MTAILCGIDTQSVWAGEAAESRAIERWVRATEVGRCMPKAGEKIGVTVGSAFTVFHSLAGTKTNSSQC